MTNATSDLIELNLDTDYLEVAIVSLIREYLARKGYRDSLATFDEEYPNKDNSLSSRSKLVEYLSIQKLYEKNKKLKVPFKSILELIISYHSAKLSNKELLKSNENKTTHFQKEMTSRGFSNKKISNDLQIDDTNEGEIYDESDKRVTIPKQNPEKIELDLKLNKLKPFTEVKSPVTQKSVIDNQKLESEYSFLRNSNINDKNSDEDFGWKLDDKNQRSKLDAKKNLLNNIFDSKIVTGQIKINQAAKKNETDSALSSQGQVEFTTRPIDYEAASSLKTLLFGNVSQVFPDEWKNQSFPFCDLSKLKFGIVQKKGGPCGVLACVQSYVLQDLLFSSKTAEGSMIFNVNKRDRSCGLAKGLAKLLWKAGLDNDEAVIAVRTNRAKFAPVGKYKSDGITETLNLLTFTNYKQLENYLIKNVNQFELEESNGCILLLYSAIFSRKIERIITDMDEKTNKLMGMHGYCTQEMVNLLIHGRAVSNVFNDSVFLDQLELRGPNARNDIGLLSLFEHYKSCEVGSYYKTPKYPIWVVCSESHFSVMFGIRLDILNDWRAETKFDLYYYDGLAKQDEQIKLTLSLNSNHSSTPGFDDSFFKMLNKGKGTEKDLIPPLELVLKTKWKDVNVDWNSTTPLL